MELTPFTIYLWQMASIWSETCILFASLSGTGLLMTSIFSRLDDEVGEGCRVFMKHFARIFFTSLILALLLPTSKTIALMYVLPKIADSEVIKKDVPEMYEMAKEALRDYVKTK